MAGNLDLRAPSSFKVLGDNTNLSKAWEQYFKRYYLKATRVTKDEQKRALPLHVAGEEVNKVQKKKRIQFKPRGAPRTFNRSPPTNFTRRTAQCYRCCRSGHYGKECQITGDAVCRKCGKYGHFAKICKTKLFTTGKVNSLNQYFEEESDQEMFTLSGKDDAIISIEIEGQSINFLIDSGSYINAIDKQTFEKLKTRKSMLEKTTIKIFPYGSSKPIPLIGKTKMNATVNNETCAIEFHFIAGNGKPLLGRKSTTELKYYADKRMSNDFQKYRIGQNVNLLRREGSKMSSRYEDKPYKVVRQRGTSVMLRSNNGHIIYRNVSHVRPYFRTFERNIHCDNRQHTD